MNSKEEIFNNPQKQYTKDSNNIIINLLKEKGLHYSGEGLFWGEKFKLID